jgi:hypothetical protein
MCQYRQGGAGWFLPARRRGGVCYRGTKNRLQGGCPLAAEAIGSQCVCEAKLPYPFSKVKYTEIRAVFVGLSGWFPSKRHQSAAQQRGRQSSEVPSGVRHAGLRTENAGGMAPRRRSVTTSAPGYFVSDPIIASNSAAAASTDFPGPVILKKTVPPGASTIAPVSL